MAGSIVAFMAFIFRLPGGPAAAGHASSAESCDCRAAVTLSSADDFRMSDQIETVIGARIDMCLNGHPGLRESVHEIQVLLQKQIERARRTKSVPFWRSPT